MALTHQVRRGSLANLGGAVASAASTLLLVVLTTRLLSAADAGRVFAATSVYLIVTSVLRLGTPTGVVLFVARTGGDDAEVRRIATLAVRPVLGLSAAAVIAGVVLFPGWWLLVACLPAGAVLDTLLAVTRGRHRMAPTVVVDRVGRPLCQLALTIAAVAHPTVWTLTAAWTLPYLLACLAALWWTPSLLAHGLPSTAEQRREFAAFVGPRAVATIIQVCFARLDIVLVAWLSGPGAAAVYTAATRFVVLCQFAQQAFATAAEPALARDLSTGRLQSALEHYRVTTTWLAALLFPALITLAVLSSVWLRLFGGRYADARWTVLVLVVAMLVAMGVGMVETVLNMAGRSSVVVGNNALGLVVMVGLDLLLIPRIGALGAATGWATAIVAKNLLGLWQLRGVVPGSPLTRGWWVAALASAGLVGVLPGAVGALVGRGPQVIAAAAGVLLLVVVYLCARSLLLGTAPATVGGETVSP